MSRRMNRRREEENRERVAHRGRTSYSLEPTMRQRKDKKKRIAPEEGEEKRGEERGRDKERQ